MRPSCWTAPVHHRAHARRPRRRGVCAPHGPTARCDRRTLSWPRRQSIAAWAAVPRAPQHADGHPRLGATRRERGEGEPRQPPQFLYITYIGDAWKGRDASRRPWLAPRRSMLDRRPMADSSGMLLRRRRTCGRSRFDDFSTDAGFARAPEPMAEPMRRHRPTPPSRETRPVRLRRVGHLVHAASRARCVRRADVVPRGRRRRPHSDPAPRRPIQHPHCDA